MEVLIVYLVLLCISLKWKNTIFNIKKLAWKTCLKELLFFIKGETDNKILNNQNVHIWDQF